MKQSTGRCGIRLAVYRQPYRRRSIGASSNVPNALQPLCSVPPGVNARSSADDVKAAPCRRAGDARTRDIWTSIL